MPAQILHTLFGEDVFEELSRRFAKELIPGALRGVFALGCQGPDIFYHAQMSRPVGLEYGTLLHRRGFGTFAAELLGEASEREALKVYALGFMTHAFLDRAAHPYIIYKTNPGAENAAARSWRARCHAFFERILDTLMLEYLRGQGAASWDQEGLLAETCVCPPPHLKDLLTESLLRAFPERAGKDRLLERRVENTFTDCAVFYAFTSPRRADTLQEIRREIPPEYLHPKRLPLDIDYLNLARTPWYYPVAGGKEDRRSFPDLYCEAVSAAALALEGPLGRFLAGDDPRRDLAGIIGGGCLSIQGADGKPCAPEPGVPLPLPEILEGQRLLRGW